MINRRCLSSALPLYKEGWITLVRHDPIVISLKYSDEPGEEIAALFAGGAFRSVPSLAMYAFRRLALCALQHYQVINQPRITSWD